MNRRLQDGVSLIEALAALAVMAFGLLGVVGMQATLRANSDVSKQRAEAVRIAQAAIEQRRGFERLAVAGGIQTFDGITDVSEPITSFTTNTSYTMSATVTPNPVASTDPKLKSLKVQVSWEDRTGQTLNVSLSSAVAGIAPELAGSLALPGDRAPTQRPRGRHPAVPPAALDLGNGTSSFAPPGGGALTWIFNNQSGFITQVCNPTPSCADTTLAPLSGFIRFVTGVAPTPALSENPTSTAVAVAVRVRLTVPSATDVDCFSELSSIHTRYFCALPVTTDLPRRWSGTSKLVDSVAISIATSLAETSSTMRKVCRYTPELTDTPSGGNAAHPLDYNSVTTPLANQNFLVISAGNGSTAYTCPTDDTATTFVNGNTFRHQPLS
jgi:Tfp pilus assembly protein PilV